MANKKLLYYYKKKRTNLNREVISPQQYKEQLALKAEIAEGEHEAGFCLDCDASPCECVYKDICPYCKHPTTNELKCNPEWCDHCGHHYPGA